jgi:hypothetical protein
MGVVASHDNGVEHIRQLDVVDEYTVSGDQSGVFKPLQWPA